MSEPGDSTAEFDLDRISNCEFISELVYFETIDSTNNVAMEIGQSPKTKHLTLVLAKHQSAGRGRGDHRWVSHPGALTFSLIIDVPASIALERRAALSVVTGLSVAEAINPRLNKKTASVKWPNDVLIDGRKVAGILIEPVPGRRDRYVFGIGVNANNPIDPAKTENATSIKEHAAHPVCLTSLLLETVATCVSNIDQWYVEPHRVVSRANAKLAHARKWVVLQTGDTCVEGECVGLDDAGRILIRDNKEGKVTGYSAGTLRF